MNEVRAEIKKISKVIEVKNAEIKKIKDEEQVQREQRTDV
jgi:hypothetical protein